jgi:hypothetical protein
MIGYVWETLMKLLIKLKRWED